MREGEPKLILQTDQVPLTGLLFSLQPGPAIRSLPALLGGSRQGFANLSASYELIQAIKLQPKLLVSADLAEAVASLPGVLALPQKSYELSGSAGWQALQDSDCALVGLDMHLGSDQQIMLSKILRAAGVTMVCTDELAAMFRFEPELLQLPTVIPLLRVQSLKQQALALQVPVRTTEARGVFGVADLLRNVEASGPVLIAYSDDHWYSYIRASDTIIHSPLPPDTQPADFVAVYWAALCLTMFARRQTTALDELIRAAHYLTYQTLLAHPVGTSEQAKYLRHLIED